MVLLQRLCEEKPEAPRMEKVCSLRKRAASQGEDRRPSAAAPGAGANVCDAKLPAAGRSALLTSPRLLKGTVALLACEFSSGK